MKFRVEAVGGWVLQLVVGMHNGNAFLASFPTVMAFTVEILLHPPTCCSFHHLDVVTSTMHAKHLFHKKVHL